MVVVSQKPESNSWHREASWWRGICVTIPRFSFPQRWRLWMLVHLNCLIEVISGSHWASSVSSSLADCEVPRSMKVLSASVWAATGSRFLRLLDAPHTLGSSASLWTAPDEVLRLASNKMFSCLLWTAPDNWVLICFYKPINTIGHSFFFAHYEVSDSGLSGEVLEMYQRERLAGGPTYDWTLLKALNTMSDFSPK